MYILIINSGGLDSHLHVVSAGNLQDLHRPLKSKEESKPTRREITAQSSQELRTRFPRVNTQRTFKKEGIDLKTIRHVNT